jgi:hypothetical protein
MRFDANACAPSSCLLKSFFACTPDVGASSEKRRSSFRVPVDESNSGAETQKKILTDGIVVELVDMPQ